ncbi:13750_t:CDS:2 [Acaulospora colombiana]|uniref:13750_t:CDS:1 n=1 Tax=Acaulospora colombiana TaxID=27376 RepID=A0ACA9N6F8_9GLOM|nr:13750_t:CDS:2 [Acaulospora colombiana]
MGNPKPHQYSVVAVIHRGRRFISTMMPNNKEKLDSEPFLAFLTSSRLAFVDPISCWDTKRDGKIEPVDTGFQEMPKMVKSRIQESRLTLPSPEPCNPPREFRMLIKVKQRAKRYLIPVKEAANLDDMVIRSRLIWINMTKYVTPITRIKEKVEEQSGVAQQQQRADDTTAKDAGLTAGSIVHLVVRS